MLSHLPLNCVKRKFFMVKPLHLLLLIIFALLQSVAPLVHAHVEGGGAGIHAPGLEAPHHILNVQQANQNVIEVAESAAISMADQLQRDDSVVFFPAVEVTQTVNVAPLVVIKISLPVVVRATVTPSYQKPHPQAPPFFC